MKFMSIKTQVLVLTFLIVAAFVTYAVVMSSASASRMTDAIHAQEPAGEVPSQNHTASADPWSFVDGGVPPRNHSAPAAPWSFSDVGILIGASALSGVLAIGVIPLALCMLGFTCWGVVAGSAAALCQSGIGNVPAGSWFSCLQHTSACGAVGRFLIPVTFLIGAGIGGTTTFYILENQHRSNPLNETDLTRFIGGIESTAEDIRNNLPDFSSTLWEDVRNTSATSWEDVRNSSVTLWEGVRENSGALLEKVQNTSGAYLEDIRNATSESAKQETAYGLESGEVPPRNHSAPAAPWSFADVGILIGAGALSGVLAIGVIPLALCILGFTCWGVLAGSAAALCQSSIGNVPAGSCFSCFQSVGACGSRGLKLMPVWFLIGAGIGGTATFYVLEDQHRNNPKKVFLNSAASTCADPDHAVNETDLTRFIDEGIWNLLGYAATLEEDAMEISAHNESLAFAETRNLLLAALKSCIKNPPWASKV
ncbi:unnamed protein product [Notodromas monacha]|uniref:Uncharacterized protein n=1 Tax=Notodromas monacha TaxID=399045 RepID=A0A7R9GHQ1_9CRUS|nr:unnamed protein product [Notodromas monacha]CAG0921736.1 unnamed protein product [Notodromas monacha]